MRFDLIILIIISFLCGYEGSIDFNRVVPMEMKECRDNKSNAVSQMCYSARK